MYIYWIKLYWFYSTWNHHCPGRMNHLFWTATQGQADVPLYSQPICFKHLFLHNWRYHTSDQSWWSTSIRLQNKGVYRKMFSHGTRKNTAFVNACLNALSYKPGPGYMELPYMQRKQYENRSELKFQTSFRLYSDLTSHGITANYSVTLHHIRSHFISIIIIVIVQLLRHDF